MSRLRKLLPYVLGLLVWPAVTLWVSWPFVKFMVTEATVTTHLYMLWYTVLAMYLIWTVKWLVRRFIQWGRMGIAGHLLAIMAPYGYMTIEALETKYVETAPASLVPWMWAGIEELVRNGLVYCPEGDRDPRSRIVLTRTGARAAAQIMAANNVAMSKPESTDPWNATDAR